jgi:hypothetical protein
MSAWTRGVIWTRIFDGGIVEVRNDTCKGWLWQLYRGAMPLTFCEAKTLAAAKRAAMREAKRLGWTP